MDLQLKAGENASHLHASALPCNDAVESFLFTPTLPLKS